MTEIKADFVIDNNGSLSQLEKEVEKMVKHYAK